MASRRCRRSSRRSGRSGCSPLAHVPMNIDYFLFHLPKPIPTFPFFKPDGLGMSVLITSPGLLFASQADWRKPRAWWLLGATIAVLIPTLLYYGGGWLQYGYRYFLDSVPFVIALCGLAAVHRGWVGHGLEDAHRVRGRRRRPRGLLGRQDLTARVDVAEATVGHAVEPRRGRGSSPGGRDG